MGEHAVEKGLRERAALAHWNAWSLNTANREGWDDQRAHNRGMSDAVVDLVIAEIASITTHNGTPVTPENLRYAANHEGLSRSWIFDVLTGLADALDATVTPPEGVQP